MLNWPIITVCAVGISILLMVVLVPGILHVSLLKRLFDRPDNRKVHHRIVPRIGGFSFLPVLVMTLGATVIVPAACLQNGQIVGSGDFITSLPDILVMLSAMTIMFLTGLYDDLAGLKYITKFVAQLVCAVMLVEAGDYITDYNHLFGIGTTTDAMGKIISGFLIISIINSLNLIDGIDGLASGICVIALSFFGWILGDDGLHMYSLIAWTGAAIMATFWVFNVMGSFKSHTKIFMGDVGSLSMGLLVAFMVLMVGRTPEIESYCGIRPLVLAFSPLVLPLFDVVRVFFVRLSHGSSPFLPDKRHIHHLLLEAGMPMKVAMALLLFSQVAILWINIAIAETLSINVVLIIDIVIYAAGISCLYFRKRLTTRNNYRKQIR